MSKKVRTLLRVSSRQQLHDGDIPLQRAEAGQYIASHPDWEFDKEYIEKAVSAYHNGVEDRRVLQEILVDAREHRFDVLLTYMSDRIGRQEEYCFYVAALNRLGIEVWTIRDGQLKTEDHVDKLLNYIRFWQNEGESRKTGLRVRDNQIELVKSGKFVGGKAPFGYRFVPSGTMSNHGRLLKKLEVVEKDAAVVRHIYQLAIRQGMGYSRIANALNEEGIPPISTDRWKASTIASILKNPIYMGYYALNRRVNHGSFTRLDRKDWVYSREQIPELVIICKQDWELAQEIREARKGRLEAGKNTVAQAPFRTSATLSLTGLVYCGYCGKKLKNGSYRNHWQTKSGERKSAFAGRYLCPSKCSQRSCYSQGYLEGAVFAAVEKYLAGIDVEEIEKELEQQQIEQYHRIEKQYQSICREQQRLQLDIAALEEKIPEAIRGDYFFSEEKLSFLLQEKEREMQQLQEQAQELLTAGCSPSIHSNPSLLPDWEKEFRQMNPPSRQMLLTALIHKIEATDGTVRIHFRFP